MRSDEAVESAAGSTARAGSGPGRQHPRGEGSAQGSPFERGLNAII